MLRIRAPGESIVMIELSSADASSLERIAEQVRRCGASVTRVRGHASGPRLRELLDELGPDLIGVHGPLDEPSILALRRSIPDGSVFTRLGAGDSEPTDRYFDARIALESFPEFVAHVRAASSSSTDAAPPVRVVDLAALVASEPDEANPPQQPHEARGVDASTTRTLSAYFGGALPALPDAWVLDGVQLDAPRRRVQLVLSHSSLGLAIELVPLEPASPAYAKTRDLSIAYRRPRVEIPPVQLRTLLDALVVGLREAEGKGPISLPERLFGEPAPTPKASAPAVLLERRAPLVCIQPWVQMEVVDPSGLVYQCCSEWTKGHRGAFPRRSLRALWNGPEYRAARRAMVEDVDALCRSICPRLEDRKFAEERFRVESGAPRFVRNQLQLAEDIALAREEVQALPTQLALCPSTYCNYDCIMCTYGRTPRRDLPEEIWEQVTELLPTLRTLGLAGGEPLANASAMSFLRRWNRAEHPDAAVDLVTNGALLTERALAHLGRCRFGSLTISLNAGTPEVYEQIQRGLQLDTVLANIDAIRQFRRAVGDDFRCTLSFVVMPQNSATLQAFGELAHARDLPIRLLPLTLGGVAELDFYADADAVARVLGHVRSFRSWVEKVRPAWLPEVRGLEAAIRGEASSRQGLHLPIVRQSPTSTSKPSAE